MYCHPSAVKKWAKAMKPQATAQQIEQAKIMRAAKQAKQIFQSRQGQLFTLSPSSSCGEKSANRTAPGSVSTFA